MGIQERTLEQSKKMMERIGKRDQKRRKRIEASGLDYECPEIVRGYSFLLNYFLFFSFFFVVLFCCSKQVRIFEFALVVQAGTFSSLIHTKSDAPASPK